MSATAERGLTPAKKSDADRVTAAIARKEFMEYTRRPWVLALAALFVVLTVGASFIAGISPGEGSEPVGFIASLAVIRSIVGLVIPIIAIILAHSSLAGEQEAGSLGLLLAQPVTRGEVVVGKALGLYGVLASAIVVGFGIGAGVIAARGGDPQWGDFLRFLLATLLYTAAYFSVFLMLSALASRRTQALLYCLGLWVFMGLLFDAILTFAAFKIAGFEALATGNLPGWVVAAQFLSIPDLYSNLMFASSRALQDLAAGQGLPSSFLFERWAPAALTGGLLAWTVGSLAVARWALARKDV